MPAEKTVVIRHNENAAAQLMLGQPSGCAAFARRRPDGNVNIGNTPSAAGRNRGFASTSENPGKSGMDNFFCKPAFCELISTTKCKYRLTFSDCKVMNGA